MKRKLDSNKIYAFIGQAILYVAFEVTLYNTVILILDNCCTVYR